MLNTDRRHAESNARHGRCSQAPVRQGNEIAMTLDGSRTTARRMIAPPAISLYIYGTDVTRVGWSVRRYYDDESEDDSRT
jgi:hypothetical protein